MTSRTDDTDQKALRAMKEATEPQDNLIVLSTGVVLRGKSAPPLVLMAVLSAFPRPKPPVMMIEAMGREMENPDDPDYQERLGEWKTEQSSAMVVALITTGTELVELPSHLPGPDDDAWIDEYALLGLPVHRDNVAWRYLRWVQSKAAVSADDIQSILKVVGRLSGVPESAVKTAENFPRRNKKSG